jgi:tetratricopeptide (TPR) repeat protein
MTWYSVNVSAAVAIGLLVTVGCGGGVPDTPWPGDPGTPRAEIVVDFAKAHYGRVPVSMRLIGVDGQQPYEFLNKAKNDEYRYYDVRFEDGDGRPIRSKMRGNSYRLDPFEGDVVLARWDAEPGGLGRHGLQGAVRDDFASFDGRLYLMPRDVARLTAIRIHFVLPWGWKVAAPFRSEGEWYYLDAVEQRQLRTLLESTCVGAGHFDIETRRIGEMDVQVASYSDWDDKHKAKITDSTFRVLQYFHDTFDFDLRSPYSVVWTPQVNRYRVHGGSHVNGTCLENPDDTLRPFQLLAHRVAHSMDKYRPAGMTVKHRRDRWFREGWPSYMEVVATEATGIAPDASHFSSLLSTYKQRAAKNPDRDLALARDFQAANDIKEYLHYFKGPLVVKMLAELVRDRSGRTLEDFMRAMWAEHGWFRGEFSLKEELEAFTGESFDDFWAMAVQSPGIVIPAWDDYVTHDIRAAMKRRPAARVGGEPVLGEYLHHLASAERFASFDDVRKFVIGEETRRRDLVARGVRLYPEEVRRHLFAMPVEDRYAIARFEASYPLDEVSAPRNDIRFEVDETSSDGRIFAELLELEREYFDAVSRGALSAMEVWAEVAGGTRSSRVGFGTDAALMVVPRWRTPPGRAEMEMTVSGNKLQDWTLRGSAGVRVSAASRRAHEGIVTFRIRADGGPPVTRGLWQRGIEPKRGFRTSSAMRSSRRDPYNADSWYKDGVADSNAGKYESALGFLAKAVEMDPADPKKWSKQGETLARLTRYDEALESFDEALELNPQYMAAAGEKALTLAELDRREESLAALEMLVEHNAEDPLRFFWMGRVRERLGDLSEAAHAYRAYTALQPRWPEGWYKLGHVLMGLERYKEAVKAFDRALALNPSDERSRRRKRAALTLQGGTGR